MKTGEKFLMYLSQRQANFSITAIALSKTKEQNCPTFVFQVPIFPQRDIPVDLHIKAFVGYGNSVQVIFHEVVVQNLVSLSSSQCFEH